MEPQRALSEEAMLAGLRDIYLPPTAPGGVLAELFAALALGLLLALVVGGMLRLVTRARGTERAPRLADRLAALRELPETERQVALLHLMRERAPERYAALKEGLYRPGGLPPAQVLETELANG